MPSQSCRLSPPLAADGAALRDAGLRKSARNAKPVPGAQSRPHGWLTGMSHSQPRCSTMWEWLHIPTADPSHLCHASTDHGTNLNTADMMLSRPAVCRTWDDFDIEVVEVLLNPRRPSVTLSLLLRCRAMSQEDIVNHRDTLDVEFDYRQPRLWPFAWPSISLRRLLQKESPSSALAKALCRRPVIRSNCTGYLPLYPLITSDSQ
ncbi:hypothetical protein CSUB01_04714 [Colletotrichum sublineola]|uniref:Uncharacterized protein n=1 Tax=Colletotrichum sublineola TaxID=1173701 RepID=A0A066XAK8_COLSU|nr:hypothetical protein CSUB01_04714 [Colletotrichum sublineola]